MAAKRQTITAALFTALLGTASVVSAAPSPATGVSKGFKLVAHIISADKTLSVPIQGALLEGAHVGAGLNTAILNTTSPGQIFYQNGTAEEVSSGKSSILSDGGTPPFPFGVRVTLNSSDLIEPVALAINGDIGTPGVTLTTPVLGPGELKYEKASFIACDETIAYYGPSWHFAVVKAFEAYPEPAIIPENCVQISLVPQCASLPDLPAGSQSSHEFAHDVRCSK
ncbi:hypothetical protein F4677DRAFT_449029 [Hypoxylon crocopeplum]|nr:hypothetical protein F4677DRAFT_449029 [Hypoxylon crocopeplum]